LPRESSVTRDIGDSRFAGDHLAAALDVKIKLLMVRRLIHLSGLKKGYGDLLWLPAASRFFTWLLFVAVFGSLQACHVLDTGTRSRHPEMVRQTNSTHAQHGPYVILFAIDGAGYDQFMDAIHSGKMRHIESLLGNARGVNLYEHAYSVPHVFTIMPSCSTAAWSSIMTGRPPAETGVAGDEFFVREENRFYAPIPLSSRNPDDFMAAIDNDRGRISDNVHSGNELRGVILAIIEESARISLSPRCSSVEL